MSWKTNVSNLFVHFPVFCKFLSDDVETVYWINEANHRKLFKSKLGHWERFRKWFWSYLEMKNKHWVFLNDIFHFFGIFWMTKLKPFSRKVRQNIKNCLNQNLVIVSFLKICFEGTLLPKTNVLSVWKWHFLHY